jgi:tRNA(adenine34) deaminase
MATKHRSTTTRRGKSSADSKRKTSPKGKSHAKGSDNRWSSKVKTVSTFPPKDTFNQDAETIAKTMAKKKVSPKGLGSAIRMVQYFINRGGKNLSASRKHELEKAKKILQGMREKKK